MNDVLAKSLRNTPDRIIVGEVRGEEAQALLKLFSSRKPVRNITSDYTSDGASKQ